MTDRAHDTETQARENESPATAAGSRPTRSRPGERVAATIPNPTRPFAEQPLPVLFAMCLFGEARGESDPARRAVAQVVLNRAQHPHRVFGSRRGADLAENLRRVILQPRQFSSCNPDDPNFAKLLRPLEQEEPAVWEACLRCAQEALASHAAPDALTANSDHYFDDSIQPPAWADPAQHTVKLGRLHFYRLYLPPTGETTIPAEERSEPASGSAPAPPHSTTLPGPFGASRGSAGEARPTTSLPASHARGFRFVGPRPYPRYDWSGRLSILALLLVSVSLTACNDLERAAHRTLAVTKAEYETVQQHVAEAAVHGLITEEQWNRFQVVGHQFIDAHNAAVDAFQIWSRTKSKNDTARLEAVLEILPRLIREINSLVESFEKKQNSEATETQRHGVAFSKSKISVALCLGGNYRFYPPWP